MLADAGWRLESDTWSSRVLRFFGCHSFGEATALGSESVSSSLRRNDASFLRPTEPRIRGHRFLAAAHRPIPRLRLRLSHSLRETPGSRLLTTRCQLRRPCHRRMRHESYSLTPGLATRARRCKAAAGCTWPSISRTTSRRPHSRAHRTPSPAAPPCSHACTPTPPQQTRATVPSVPPQLPPQP